MEASVVLPMIILAVITAVLVIMFFFSQMSERSRMHIELRKESGRAAESTAYLHQSAWEGEIYTEKKGVGGEVYGKKYLIMEHSGLLSKKGTFIIEDRCFYINAAQYVRYCNVVKGMGNEQ